MIDANDAIKLAGEMNGFRWELPCDNPEERDVCTWDSSLLEGSIEDDYWALRRENVVVFGGDAGTGYDVTFRVRGVTEPKNFTGGEVQKKHFQIGGEPVVDDYNIYSIRVSDPAQVYTLNRNERATGHFTFVVDYTVTIPIDGGAEVVLGMYDHNTLAIANPGGSSAVNDPLAVPGVPPFPEPYFGHFLQLDVISVTRR
jgi:hypothetical protein